MTLMEEVRHAIREGRMPPIFKRSDLQKANIQDANDNLSNYDKKNRGSSNKNKKVLISTEIGGEIYYAFDEQLFD